MYTIILFALIGFCIFIITELIDYKKGYGLDIDFSLCFFTSFIFVFIGLIIAIALPVKYEESSWDEEIVSLKDNTSISGNFFLGSGMINGTMRYVYYQKNQDETYKMWQTEYYRASIRYTNNTPKIVIIDKRESKSLWNKFALDPLNNESYQNYIFEVPKGSIEKDYNLDAQ
tara:strand:+ start:547 stop:1062 length:516 start_codon:yes stop_codon:yes gene_type:complete